MTISLPPVRFAAHKPVDKSAVINQAALNADFSATINERLDALQDIVQQLQTRFGITLSSDKDDFKNGVKPSHNNIEVRVLTGAGSKTTMPAVEAGLKQIGLEKTPGKFSYTAPGSGQSYDVKIVPTQRYIILRKKPAQD